MNDKQQDSSQNKKLGLLAIVGSALSAVVGIQTQKNRERDFKHGKASTFIIVGVVVTVAIVLTLVVVVRLILSQATH